MHPAPALTIRPASADEFDAVGELIATAYAGLPGMARPDEQPDYYRMLRDVGARARNPAITVFAAVGPGGALMGSVDFISDVKHYGSGGTASTVPDAAGIRLLAVKPEYRGAGVGKALTQHCIERARALGRARVILHTTRAMQTAWAMYERMGFRRDERIDFRQGNLEVFGFRLEL